MHLLADENIRLKPFVPCVPPGASDVSHIELAIRDERLIITFDQDFGDLAVRGPCKPTAGVLLLRFNPASATAVTDLLTSLFQRTDVTWSGHLTVADDKHLRQRSI